MNFVEYIRVGKERTEAGFGAEIDNPAAILCAWIVRRIGIAENASAEGDEAMGARFLLGRYRYFGGFRHGATLLVGIL